MIQWRASRKLKYLLWSLSQVAYPHLHFILSIRSKLLHWAHIQRGRHGLHHLKEGVSMKFWTYFKTTTPSEEVEGGENSVNKAPHFLASKFKNYDPGLRPNKIRKKCKPIKQTRQFLRAGMREESGVEMQNGGSVNPRVKATNGLIKFPLVFRVWEQRETRPSF